ncbi:MAG: substrate-binding domain-containing protein [Anaerolineales bacterium]|nr:substrate-binding domain-containing protein [Anaerolineales bacterium]
MKCVTRKTKQTLVVMTLALASCRGPMQAPTPTPEVVPLYFVSTSSTHPLLWDLTTVYSRDNELIAIIDQNSTGITLQQALDHPNATTAYAITHQLPDMDDFWAAPLGQDGIAIITHPNLTAIHSLSAEDLRAIFTGTAQNWSEFNGPNLRIIVVSREATSPIRGAFENQVLGQRPMTLRARLATTANAMHDIVAQTPGAIGFISMAQADQEVRVVPLIPQTGLAPVFPTPHSVFDATYPLRLPILVIGNHAPQPEDGYYEFILWAQQAEGQAIIAQYYAPLRDLQ